ncbi:hypothetical protein TNCV_2724681 [Trichonephila clavipes]|nr:hypothetical protein TNCV_2724681 [Trichonephila clavipes]
MQQASVKQENEVRAHALGKKNSGLLVNGQVKVVVLLCESVTYRLRVVVLAYAQVCEVRPLSKSVDFHDGKYRQRPCRMIMRYVKDP